MVVSANDVAAYILGKAAPMTTMKLQKLLYYVQGWSLAWDEKPLYSEEIQAWANGPVVPAVLEHHKDKFEVKSWKWGDPKKLNKNQAENVDIVLGAYGKFTGHQMSDKIYTEPPYQKARPGLEPGQPSHNKINLDDMQDYFGGLDRMANAHATQE